MLDIICREVKRILVDTWVNGLIVEVCLVYLFGEAVISYWQETPAISVTLILLGLAAFLKIISMLRTTNLYFCIAMVLVGLLTLMVFM